MELPLIIINSALALLINSALALLRVISRFAGGSLNEWGTGSVHVTSPLPPRHETIVAIIQDRVTAVG